MEPKDKEGLKPYCYICGKRDIQEPIIISLSEETDRAFIICSPDCLKRAEPPIYRITRTPLQKLDEVDTLELAIMFHHTYEKFAPDVGYDTRKETRIFDPQSPNGKLMLKVCEEIKKHYCFCTPKIEVDTK